MVKPATSLHTENGEDNGLGIDNDRLRINFLQRKDTYTRTHIHTPIYTHTPCYCLSSSGRREPVSCTGGKTFTRREMQLAWNLNVQIECISRQRSLTCQLSLRSGRQAQTYTVQPSVQGQQGDSTLTDRLVMPRHVTPGNTGEPLFHSSLCRSLARHGSPAPPPFSDPERWPIASHREPRLPPSNSSYHPSNASSNRLLDRHRRVADSPSAASMISHSRHEKEVSRSLRQRIRFFGLYYLGIGPYFSDYTYRVDTCAWTVLSGF